MNESPNHFWGPPVKQRAGISNADHDSIQPTHQLSTKPAIQPTNHQPNPAIQGREWWKLWRIKPFEAKANNPVSEKEGRVSTYECIWRKSTNFWKIGRDASACLLLNLFQEEKLADSIDNYFKNVCLAESLAVSQRMHSCQVNYHYRGATAIGWQLPSTLRIADTAKRAKRRPNFIRLTSRSRKYKGKMSQRNFKASWNIKT